MRAFTLLLGAAVLAAPALADSTSAGRCYSISDPDHRSLCRAREHKEPGMCYSIQRQDLRAECLAEAHK